MGETHQLGGAFRSGNAHQLMKNGREILQMCPSKFVNPKLKVGTVGGGGSLEIQECLGEEIFQERR